MGRLPSKGRTDPYRETQRLLERYIKKIRTRVLPYPNQHKIPHQSGPMEHSRRYSGTNSQGNTTRTQEKETQTTSTFNKQQHKSGQKKCKNCRYKKPNIPITNLSNHQLSRDETNQLSKGLNFIQTPRRDHPAKMLQDILLFDRKIRLKYHFTNEPDQSQGPLQQTNNQILQPSSGWTPLVDKTHF